MTINEQKQIKDLTEKRNTLLNEARAMLTATEGKRNLTAEENTKFDKLHNDAEQLRSQAETIKRQADADSVILEAISEEKESRKSKKYAGSAFNRYLRYGSKALTPEERIIAKRALSAGGATAGAEFVPETFYNRFHEVLKLYGGVREAVGEANIIRTSNGQPLPFPKWDDTSNTGELVAENDAATDDGGADPASGEVVLNAYKYTSEVVNVSNELLQDAAYDVEGALARSLSIRIFRKTNADLTNADGSNKPQGCRIGAGAGVTGDSATVITYNEMLDLIHSVNPMYRTGAKFMFNDSTLLAVRKLVDADGNPLWNFVRNNEGMPSNIAGFPYVINPDMPDIGAGLVPILFGNFGLGYALREVGNVLVKRSTENNWVNDQTSFLAVLRCDGGVIDNTAIKKYTMAAS